MPAFYVAQMTIKDAELYRTVQSRFPSVFQKYRGRVLAADSDFEVLEGQFDGSRVVIIEFQSEEDLKAWYFSPEYQETVAIRKQAANANIIIAHGMLMESESTEGR